MNRTDRLYALVEELRARAPRPVPARQLAERFEVSVRTIERDVLALLEAGVPIWSERGRAGGYAIDPRHTLPPLNLDADEALAVIVALATAPVTPFTAAARSARHKLMTALHPDTAASARLLGAQLRLPSPEPSDAAPPEELLRAVSTAVRDRRVVELSYVDGHGRVSHRTVEAHGLHLSGGSTYLIGWCRLRDDGRVFRLDRITDLTLTATRAPQRDVDAVLDVPFPTTTPDVP